MIHLANILIAAEEQELGQRFLQEIRRHGYDGQVVSSLAAAVATAQQEQPDIILAAETLEGGTALDLAQRLHAVPACAAIPICVAAASRQATYKVAALAAGVDDVLLPPIAEVKLVARLRPLVRLAIMRTELRQRARIAGTFGVSIAQDIVTATTPAQSTLLVVGQMSRVLKDGLKDARVHTAADPFIAADMLERENYDAIILVAGITPAPYLDLCAQARNNPRLFNLPVLFVTEPGHVDETDAYGHGASGFFTTPLDLLDLQTSIQIHVRRQQARWALRKALTGTLATATRDPETGVYSRAFFDAYVKERVPFSARYGHHLTVMFIRVPDVEGVRIHFGGEQAVHLRLQVAQWITSLLRGEDVTARYEENEFCVVLPDTPQAEAEVVLHRIAGVLAYTDFAVREVYQPVKIWARVGAADLEPEDSAERLISRARARIH
jgi:two-component system cell cycle response regulator